jgi:hypothetical protein
MTLDDIKLYFGNSYQFHKKTGMEHANYLNWYKKGFIPIKTQLKLEKLTAGKLRADLNHIDRGFDDRERKEGTGGIKGIQTAT